MKHIHKPTNRLGLLNPILVKIILLVIAMISIYLGINNSYVAKASAYNQVNVRIDLLEEIAVVSPGSGSSTKFYISTDNLKSWELIDYSGVVDLSSILTSKMTDIYFRGNKDLTPVKIELPAEDRTLKVKYEIMGGEGRIVLSDTTLPVEYRKGNNGAWRTAYNYMPTAIYELKGATLYFRTAATAYRRAGRIVTVKISKKPAAPSVSLDAGKLSITGLKAGQTQYRVGDAIAWTTFESLNKSASTIDLFTLLAGIPTSNNAVPAGIIEFRTAGSDKKLNSAVKVIEVLPQPIAPDNITLTGTTLTISDPDVKRYYEYTIVPKYTAVDINSARWTSVTSKKPVIIRKIAVGDRILVRIKSAKLPDTKQTVLPSTYKELTVTAITTTK